ncbi:Oidioi.mRNA.OKI2018_I69.chr2.g5999.t1.cds [Oikopleura dioica]|uniref:Metalloendopeptidase n=1 Tax=Oikopleura dioica TaxID=34765 RepID=A0ABN7T1P6_OIKDI|nr:Oidioi.mRNA.OKI2018_I69.chr2.g5999.t1.cds [Oikopleura dioica]
MKLFKFFAVSSAVGATERPETDDVFMNQCQAAYLESKGIKIDQEMIIEDDCDKEGEENRAAVGTVTRWTNLWDPAENKFIVPYYFAEGYEDLVFGKHTGARSMEVINENVAHFERLTCIKMKLITEVEKDDYTSVIRVYGDDPNKECSSGIGRSFGDSFVHMRADCYTWNEGTTINHEFMHRLGFLHEHSRADRDEHVTIHANKVNDWNYRKLTYGPSDIGQWEDLNSPYDFNSIMHYYSGTQPDGLPTISVAGNLAVRAPVDRTWPMSDQDAFQLNAYQGCEMNNKCADAGPNRCGAPFHVCLNQPIGYECVCVVGFERVIDADGVQTCIRSPDPTSEPTPPPAKLVQDMVVMIDGSGSYSGYREATCDGLKTLIRRGIDIEEKRNEKFRFGFTLYSDRTFMTEEFTRTSSRVYDLAMPLVDVSTFVKDDGKTIDEGKLDDVKQSCITRLGSMYGGGDWEEDVLSGAIWTRSADAMNWSEDSAKSIIVATDVHYWTQERGLT